MIPKHPIFTNASFNETQTPASGSFNQAIFITFENGVEWVFWSQHTGYGMVAMEVSARLFESEVATMEYVGGSSEVPGSVGLFV